MNVRRECLVLGTIYGQRIRGGGALIGERNREKKGKREKGKGTAK